MRDIIDIDDHAYIQAISIKVRIRKYYITAKRGLSRFTIIKMDGSHFVHCVPGKIWTIGIDNIVELNCSEAGRFGQFSGTLCDRCQYTLICRKSGQVQIKGDRENNAGVIFYTFGSGF